MIVKVALSIPYTLPYDYEVPAEMIRQMKVGLRVLVSVGSRRMIGVAVEIMLSSDYEKLKPVLALIDREPVFSPRMLAFTKWISSYYLCCWGEVLDASLPAGLKPKVTKKIQIDMDDIAGLSLDAHEEQWLNLIDGKGESEVLRNLEGENFSRLYAKLKKKKAMRFVYSHSTGDAGTAFDDWLSYQAEAGDAVAVRKGSQTDQILAWFRSEHELRLQTVLERFPKARPQINRLVAKRVLLQQKKEIPIGSRPSTVNLDLFIHPNAEQKAAIELILEAIHQKNYRTFLLHGVTGSGKTEIYLYAVKETIQQGQTVLVLIPEISLTPQAVRRFRERFGDRIAVLHSGMAEKERATEWWKIKRGLCDIVIGARSAIFAPLENIGLIVVDEEHDNSYKQQENPFYHARDAAVKIASDQGCVVLLGSATPSVESYFNVSNRKYDLLQLKNRVNRQTLPTSELINLKNEKRQKGAFYLSQHLVNRLKENLQHQKQALIFLNRRGYASFLSCVACEMPVLCRNCSIAMTWHRTRQRLICHHCGFSQPYPKTCPHCQESVFNLEGIGTQRVERDLKLLFPDARFLRMDRDTVRKRGALERYIDKINDKQIDFIIGTQLISKGHDFKHIGIVCIIFADMSLNIPDFRSSERSFQLISQVSGRAGRDEKLRGLALIQSYNPDHFIFRTAIEHDFLSFFNQELSMRRDLNNPPYVRQILIKVSDKNPDHAEQSAMALGGVLKDCATGADFQVMGPVESPLQKINNRYYWLLLIKSGEIGKAKSMLAGLFFGRKGWRAKAGSRISIDVDPMTML
ncbi:primosomal protein N' [bacterium]|nr:primosomal protein N' [bacterium]